MIQSKKIKVLYFDKSDNTTARFLELCGTRDIIDVVGTWKSFTEIFDALDKDNYKLLDYIGIDVIVIRISHSDFCSIDSMLARLKSHCHVKIIGILSGENDKNWGLHNALDFHIDAANPNNIMTDEDVYTRLIYQIKSARLDLMNEMAGIKGKWAIIPTPPKPAVHDKFDIIAIGASAGGTEALTKILTNLPTSMPPILVVQHIPENFADFFASNLSLKVPFKIVVAHDGEELKKGSVYIAGNDKHLEVMKDKNEKLYAKCINGEKISGHRPSVDVLFKSVAKVIGGSAMGIILTGMGSDGAQGLLEMHNAGAYTIGQDKESSAVYGMPMVAYSLGAVSKQLPLDSIPKAIISAISRSEREES